MYRLIFYFFYTLFKKRKDGDEKFQACIITWFTQLIHVLFLFAIIKYVYFLETNKVITNNNFDTNFLNNKYYGVVLIALPWIIFLFRYYNKERIALIDEKYIGVKMLTLKNVWKVVLLILVPLAIVIRLSILTTVH